MARTSEWVEMDLVVTVKAYPNVSQSHGEAVCVAGVRIDSPEPEWVRLFPVNYRDMPEENRFAKWDVIRVQVSKHSTDRRAESWRPNTDSVQRLGSIPAGGHWPARRQIVDPLIGPTMCELNRGREGGAPGPSRGLGRGEHVLKLDVSESDDWTPAQLLRLDQTSLLADKPRLEKPGHRFAYQWLCAEPDCRGHNQGIVDWELGQAYRHWQRQGYDPLAEIPRKWLEEICADDRETFFFVGDQHRWPGLFLVLGAFWPRFAPDANQLQLAVA